MLEREGSGCCQHHTTHALCATPRMRSVGALLREEAACRRDQEPFKGTRRLDGSNVIDSNKEVRRGDGGGLGRTNGMVVRVLRVKVRAKGVGLEFYSRT